MVFYFETESLKSNVPCIKKDFYIILTCFRTMLMNVRQYIFNLQRLCSTERQRQVPTFYPFSFFYCKLWMDRKQNSSTLWLMYTDISFVILKKWNIYFILDIKCSSTYNHWWIYNAWYSIPCILYLFRDIYVKGVKR